MKIKGLKSVCMLCDKLVKDIPPRNTTEYDTCNTCCPDCMVSSLANKNINERRRTDRLY